MIADAEGIDPPHGVEAEPAGDALICERAVDEAVAQHPFPGVQGRADDLVQMVGARGGEEQGFRFRAPAFVRAVEQEAADRLGAGAAARLARGHQINAACLKGRGQRLQLRRFANPLAPFEGDEAASRHAAPNRLFRPYQMRPKKPASPTSVSAASGITCGGEPSPVSTTRSAMCWPCAIGAWTGPL